MAIRFRVERQPLALALAACKRLLIPSSTPLLIRLLKPAQHRRPMAAQHLCQIDHGSRRLCVAQKYQRFRNSPGAIGVLHPRRNRTTSVSQAMGSVKSQRLLEELCKFSLQRLERREIDSVRDVLLALPPGTDR